ncbi:M28 family peptidase [Brachybacterium sp. FME24]|uniref:M28 family peptidase n=1 Tax=Brachybacterium sp. FME24 TaxID=2742605 RepID=UPI001D055323|nr:M28 family peptidase [Brachybacterium sp. FME24]
MTTQPGPDHEPPQAPDPALDTAARSAVTTRDGTGMLRGQVLLLFVVLLVVVALGVGSRGVSDPVGADAPQGVFSADRAASAASDLVAQPRPVGTAANAEAHAALDAQLSDLGFTTETQESIGTRVNGDEGVAGYTRNLIGTRSGTNPTGTIVLATHIDSVPHAPGAADAGIGLSVILETVRALGPEAQRNDLVILLVDGEEPGLLGAEAYVQERTDDLAQPVVVLNHEARGISGRPIVTRAQGPMHEVLGSMPHPEFESFTDALFGIIPNDTDFTVYREADWWGMDMAIIDDAWAYHSPQDDADHLDPATLQHYGDMTLAMTRDLTVRDLGALEAPTDGAPVQTTAPWGIVQIPPLLVTGLGLTAPVALLGVILLRRQRGELTFRGTGLGALIAAIVLPLSIVAPVLLWQITAGATPEMLSQTTGDPVRADLFLLAELVAAAAVVAGGWVLARLLIGRAALTTGAALLTLVLLAVLAVASPALGSSLVPPAAIAAFGALLAAVLPPLPGLVVRAVTLLPTAWMLGTQLSALWEFGIASAAGGLAGTAVIGLAAAAALFLGRTDRGCTPLRRPRRLLITALPAVLAVALAIGGTAYTQASPEPVQERVIAQVDGATGETTWDVTGSTDWGRELDGATAISDIAPPAVTVTSPTEASPGRVEIALTSPREAAQFELSVDEGGLSEVSIDGSPLRSVRALSSLAIVGAPQGQDVIVTATVADGAELSVVGTTFDPTLAAGWIEPGEEVSLMQPQLAVTVTAPL